MPTRNVNLTEMLDRFIIDMVDKGRYENASEVVRSALRNLEREEQEYENKIIRLREEIQKGINSGTSKRKIPEIMEAVEARMRANGEL